MRLYFEAGRKAFQRNLTYKLATFTGIIVNSFFGYIGAYIYVTVYDSGLVGNVGGYTLTTVLSYIWLSQGLIAVCQIWFDKEISKTIMSGDVISDFSKPFDYQTFWLSRFAGNSFHGFIFRLVPTYAIGMLLFGAQLPRNLITLPLFLISLSLSVVVSFLIGYMFNITTFWTLNPGGVLMLGATMQMFFSGFTVPLVYMPDWIITLCNLLPFRAIIFIPTQIWLEQSVGWDLLAVQGLWCVVLWLAARGLTRLAFRKVVIQGG